MTLALPLIRLRMVVGGLTWLWPVNFGHLQRGFVRQWRISYIKFICIVYTHAVGLPDSPNGRWFLKFKQQQLNKLKNVLSTFVPHTILTLT